MLHGATEGPGVLNAHCPQITHSCTRPVTTLPPPSLPWPTHMLLPPGPLPNKVPVAKFLSQIYFWENLS